MAEPQKGMTVLLATDGSRCAQVALDLVRTIDWPSGSVIHLVTAVERSAAVYFPSVGTPVADPVERGAPVIGGVMDDLDELCRSLESTGARIETSVLLDRAASAIVDKADAIRADLIVVGSRGHGTIASMALGSVSAEVADHAHCPVLVARRTSWRRAIIGVDGSSFARTAEDVVARWPIFASMDVDVVSVAETELSWTTGLALSAYAGSIDYPETVRSIDRERQRSADEAAARLATAGRHTKARLAEGDAATQLVHIAERDGVDVVVVGTHGRSGLRRAIAGSVARNVMLHAHCSVLIVREVRPVT